MIEINDPEAPDYLSDAKVEASKTMIREQVANGDQKLNIPNHWSDKNKNNTIKDTLFEMHHNGKCCYCERKRTRKREMDVEHYRPKARVTDELSHKGYWWLAYDWNNYLWSCKSCNEGYKINQFPLLSGGIRAENEEDELELEKPCLINPRFEEPNKYLAYYKKKLGGRWLARLMALPGLNADDKQRAEETIRIPGLNRAETGDDLITERGESLTAEFEEIAYGLRKAEFAIINAVELEAVKLYENVIKDYRKRLEKFVNSDMEFSGFFRYFLTDIGIDYSDLI
jgi:uncharacterized protein (TIGR02646 family)